MTIPVLKNDRFLRAVWRLPIDKTPVWIMRQAGRYLPEYRKIREQAGSFIKLCKTPELACEVTLQPLARFPLDAAIIFSDILTIPDAMGLGLTFKEGQGPTFASSLQDERVINRLNPPNLADLAYVYETIKLVQKELAGKVPLIGFAGSPWTLAAYAVQGKAVSGFPKLQKMRLENPDLLHKLLDILAESVTRHLNAQIEAGVQAVMIFDTWGGLLNEQEYAIFSLHYIKYILTKLHRTYNNNKVPAILFTKGGAKFIKQIAQSGCDVIGLDWQMSLREAREVVQDIALQGNMDPGTLLNSHETIRTEVSQILASFGYGSGHIFNLGHGITPDIPPENVAVMIDAVHEFSKIYHL